MARESRRELAAASAAREPQVDGVGSVVDQANNEYFQAFQGCAEQRRDATLASAAPDLEALRVAAAIADPALPDAEAFRPYFVRQQSIGRRCADELVLALFGAPFEPDQLAGIIDGVSKNYPAFSRWFGPAWPLLAEDFRAGAITARRRGYRGRFHELAAGLAAGGSA